MNRIFSSVLAALMCVGGTAASSTAGVAADLGTYYDDSGVCGQPWVLGKISNRFRYQVTHVPHLPDVRITDFQAIYQHRYLPAQDDRPIGRRYCGAKVVLSDGQNRDIWYLIEEGQGFAGIGNNVEFCVSGFDRWYVYNGRCRILR